MIIDYADGSYHALQRFGESLAIPNMKVKVSNGIIILVYDRLFFEMKFRIFRKSGINVQVPKIEYSAVNEIFLIMHEEYNNVTWELVKQEVNNILLERLYHHIKAGIITTINDIEIILSDITKEGVKNEK